jgi:hypothetical protein
MPDICNVKISNIETVYDDKNKFTSIYAADVRCDLPFGHEGRHVNDYEERLKLQRLVTRRCRERMVEFTPTIVSGRGEIATVELSWDMFIRLLIDAEYLA